MLLPLYNTYQEASELPLVFRCLRARSPLRQQLGTAHYIERLDPAVVSGPYQYTALAYVSYYHAAPGYLETAYCRKGPTGLAHMLSKLPA